MHADLSSMLKSGQYSDDMNKVFRKVMTDLESDQAAIERGERVEELQLSFEVVATGVDKKKSPVELQQQVACETEEYLEEFDQTEQSNISPTKAGFFKPSLDGSILLGACRGEMQEKERVIKQQYAN